MNNRVVITGLGAVTSIGIGWKQFWDSLLAGKSGISEIESFDTSKYERHFAGEIKNFDAYDFIDRKKIKMMGRSSQLAISATRMALEDAKLSLKAIKENTGVIIGTTMGEAQLIEQMDKTWVETHHEKVDTAIVPQYTSTALSSNIGITLGIKGMNFLIPTACAAGNYAIGYGFDLLRQGKFNKIISGGSDALSLITFNGFGRIYAMAPKQCKPFDKNREGMMLGEGAGILILETLESAQERNAPIYGEIVGYGLSCDAHHMVHPRQEGIIKCMKKALKDAGVEKERVDYICAHGTGTHENDIAESQAIKQVFDGRHKNIPTSSIKSMLGHTMGAASALEAIACSLTCKFDKIPPTINYSIPDPECDIDCVPNFHRSRQVNVALNNSYAFGGNDACVVIKKFSDN